MTSATTTGSNPCLQRTTEDQSEPPQHLLLRDINLWLQSTGWMLQPFNTLQDGGGWCGGASVSLMAVYGDASQQGLPHRVLL